MSSGTERLPTETTLPQTAEGHTLAEHARIFQEIVQHITAIEKIQKEGLGVQSCASHLMDVSNLFRAINKAPFGELCDLLRVLTEGDLSNVNRNWNFDAQSFVNNAMRLIYSALFAIVLDSTTKKIPPALHEQVSHLKVQCSKYKVKPPSSLRIVRFEPTPPAVSVPAPSSAIEEKNSSQADTVAPLPATATRPTTQPTSPWSNAKTWEQLILSVDKLLNVPDTNGEFQGVVTQVASIVNDEYSVRFQDVLSSIASANGESWTASDPKMKITKNLVAPIVRVLNRFCQTIGEGPKDSRIEGKSVGAYFLLNFSLSSENIKDIETLVKLHESMDELPEVAFLEMIEETSETTLCSVCLEVPMPSFMAYEIKISGKKMLIPVMSSISFCSAERLEEDITELTSDRLFGVAASASVEQYMVITLESGRYAIPIESRSANAARYVPSTRDLARFRKFGYAGTAHLDDGSEALIWDLSVALDRWVRKFTKSNVSLL